jgi:multiple sugar transport system permease protein
MEVDNKVKTEEVESVKTQKKSYSQNNKIATITNTDLETLQKRQKAKEITVKTVTYVFLIFFAFITIFPFYWMIISSLKTDTEYRLVIPTFFPHEFCWGNYAEALQVEGFWRALINTLGVAVVSTLLSIVITILAAYAFARLKFRGRDTLFAVLLMTMMIPGELFTITNYATVSTLGWKNSYQVLIVPFLVSVFYIYLLRQNFKQIPDELYYAAKVDGASDFKYLLKVMIPLAMPSIISITILKMMGAWNSYIWCQLVNDDKNFWLISVWLRNSSFVSAADRAASSTGNTNYPIQMAACVIVSTPLFLVFLFFRKYIIRGVSRSGTKG